MRRFVDRCGVTPSPDLLWHHSFFSNLSHVHPCTLDSSAKLYALNGEKLIIFFLQLNSSLVFETKTNVSWLVE